MKQLKIGLDADGVLYDTYPHWLGLYHARLEQDGKKDDFTYEDMTTYRLSDKVAYPDVLESIMAAPYFFADLPLMEHAQWFVRRLQEDGHNIFIVTTCRERFSWSERDKRMAFRRDFSSIHEDNVIFMSNKHLLRLSVLVEDRLQTVELLENPGILMAAPYNETNVYPRYNSLPEIYEHICQLASHFK